MDELKEWPQPRREGDRRATRWILLGLGGGLVVVALAVAALVFVRLQVLIPFRQAASSMEPTVSAGQLVFTDGTVRPEELALGDVIAFRSIADEDVPYLKRLVGLPGARVELRRGQLLIDGVACDRTHEGEYTYAHASGHTETRELYRETCGDRSWRVLEQPVPVTGRDFGPVTVADEHLFVLGDDRDNSADSRHWGQVPADRLIGRVAVDD